MHTLFRSRARRPRQWTAFQRMALGFVIVASLIPLAIDTPRILTGHTRAIADSNRNTTNLARAIAQHADDTFRTADDALGAFVERIEADGSGNAALIRIRHAFDARAPALSALKQLAFADARGTIVVGSAPAPLAVNIADQPYFHFHRDHPDRTTRISAAQLSLGSTARAIPLTRRVNHPDGSFAGVFLAEINADYFQDYYATFDIGQLGSIGLLSADGLLLVRRPFDANTLNMDLSQGSMFQALEQRGPVGSIAIRAGTDGMDRLISYRRVGGYPLVVVATLQTNEALTPWREGAFFDIVSDLAIALLIAMFGTLFLRKAGQLSTTLATLASRERQYRMLADNTSDMIVHIAHGIRVYVSPACRQLTQFEPEELIGQPAGSNIHPDDRADWTAAEQGLASTARTEQSTHRIQRRDGVYIWIEANRYYLPDDQGYVVAARDISARKAAEIALQEAKSALEAANLRLESLTRQDALTGLSNRRHFDEALETELRRAMRGATPLALILIDIDHFKLFNDHYGHPGGDDCLRQISGAIAQLSTRPGDVTARYGGEELAILLPNTSQSGALAVAERVLNAVRNLRIAHDNSPCGVVTVSIGVASVITPIHDLTRSDTFVQAADRMLYAAKRNGRNRIFPQPDDHQTAPFKRHTPARRIDALETATSPEKLPDKWGQRPPGPLPPEEC